MRSVVLGTLAAIIISVGVGLVMTSMNPTSGETYSTSGARI